MKKIILSLLLSASAYASAQTCPLIIPLKPGGATDAIARVFQKHNSDVTIDYKPGAYAIPAMSHADKNPSAGILSLPSMYSKQSPNQNPNVDPVKVFGSYDHGIITNKAISFDDLLTKKVNLGITFVGSPAHVIGEQLKAINQKIELIAFGGDTNAFVSVKNGDVDGYITAWPAVDNWTTNHGFKIISKIPSHTGTVQKGVTLSNISRHSIFMSKNASDEQRENMLKCVNKVLANEDARKELRNLHITLLNYEGVEARKVIQTYIDTLNYYGI